MGPEARKPQSGKFPNAEVGADPRVMPASDGRRRTEPGPVPRDPPEKWARPLVAGAELAGESEGAPACSTGAPAGSAPLLRRRQRLALLHEPLRPVVELVDLRELLLRKVHDADLAVR